MRTIKFTVLIFAVMIYSFACTENKNNSLQPLATVYDTINLDSSVSYNTVADYFIGVSYEKKTLKNNRFFSDSFLQNLYSNFTHPGFFRIGGTSVDSFVWHTYHTTLYNLLDNADIVRFSVFPDSIKAKDSSSLFWKIIYALPVAPYRMDTNYITDVHKEGNFVYDSSLTTSKLMAFITGNEPNTYGD